MNIYFSDYFGVSKEELDQYGAFNISLINDLPVFIDPFLLFSSDENKFDLTITSQKQFVRNIDQFKTWIEIAESYWHQFVWAHDFRTTSPALMTREYTNLRKAG